MTPSSGPRPSEFFPPRWITSGLVGIRPQSRIGPWQISGKYNSASSAACTDILFVLRGGRRQNPIRADQLRRATGLSMFGLLDYRWPHSRVHSPRAERMTEKSAVTPSAMSVQTKKKAPLDLAMLPPTPTPFPIMWMTGTTNPRSDPRRMMTYPDRRSASSSVRVQPDDQD